MKNIIDENNIFNIITPTFNRSPDIIERCVVSVDAQIYKIGNILLL
jgi:cellulose synthase/poly-beta-1,6-N-acetylglucosamine synthase-like glycosyltransferase